MTGTKRTKIEARLAAAEAAVNRRVAAVTVDMLVEEYRAASPAVQDAIELAMGRLKHASRTGDPAVAAAAQKHGTAAVVLAEIARNSPEVAARVAAKIGITIPSAAY